jgi:hypothetical protein
LIHIAEDPREDVNVLSERRDVAAELCAKTRAWFEEIKGEPHAFHMPEFVIGDRDPHTFVAAYAPVRITGELHNTGNGLKNFRTTADAADYSVVVKRAGEYRVSIDYTRGNDRAIALRLTCGDHRLVAPLGSGGFEELGTMYLPEGRRMLRLEVAEADPSDTPIIAKVVMLRFEPA